MLKSILKASSAIALCYGLIACGGGGSTAPEFPAAANAATSAPSTASPAVTTPTATQTVATTTPTPSGSTNTTASTGATTSTTSTTNTAGSATSTSASSTTSTSTTSTNSASTNTSATSAGPAYDSVNMPVFCPGVGVAATIRNKCKAGSTEAFNAILGINQWLNNTGPKLKVASVTLSGTGASVGDTCSIGFEPGIGIWMMTFKSTVSLAAGITFAGTVNEQIQTEATGKTIVYMSAGDADFATGTKGKMEINFPGATNGKTMEVVYGKGGQFVMCNNN